MAKNWKLAEAVQVIVEGKDKESIQDIARRFPLFATNAARGVEGLMEILKATPEHLTARKIESVLKAGIEESDVEETEEEVEVEEKPKKEKAKKDKKEKAKKEKDSKKGKKSKKEEVEEDEDDEDDDWDDEEEEDDEEEDNDDDGLEDMSLPQLRKEAKKRKIDIKGLKSKEEIIAALRGEELEDEDDEDDEDDDDWDI